MAKFARHRPVRSLGKNLKSRPRAQASPKKRTRGTTDRRRDVRMPDSQRQLLNEQYREVGSLVRCAESAQG